VFNEDKILGSNAYILKGGGGLDEKSFDLDISTLSGKKG
jgi:hypothetical protein